MDNILVTGGAGFVGTNLVNRLVKMKLEKDNSVFTNGIENIVVIDKLDYCSMIKNWDYEPSKETFTFYHNNINNEVSNIKILNDHNINIIFHLAAQTHVDNSFSNTKDFIESNINGTNSLLNSVVNYGKVKLFIHMSTDEVYGETSSKFPFTEFSVLNPTNPYAATKCGAEFIVKSYYKSWKIPSIIIRANNIYGRGQFPEKVIPAFIVRSIEGKPLMIHGTGNTKRIFIHVNDVIDGLFTVVTSGSIGEIYNIGGSEKNEFTVNQIAQLISSKLNKKLIVENTSDRNFNDKRYFISSDLLKSLGWSEKIDFNEGINETINWYLFNY